MKPTFLWIYVCLLAGLATPLVGCGHDEDSGGGLVNVRALIDGRSHLVLQNNTAHWHHLEYEAPGRCEEGPPECSPDANAPTYLNGKSWYPTWPDEPDTQNEFCDCDSSTYSGIPAVQPREQMVQLEIIHAREHVEIAQRPAENNFYTIIIKFDDNGTSGADWYEINVTYGGAPTEISWCEQKYEPVLICDVDETSCMFLVGLVGSSCQIYCEDRGGGCTTAYANSDYNCGIEESRPCAEFASDMICTCTQFYGGSDADTDVDTDVDVDGGEEACATVTGTISIEEGFVGPSKALMFGLFTFIPDGSIPPDGAIEIITPVTIDSDTPYILDHEICGFMAGTDYYTAVAVLVGGLMGPLMPGDALGVTDSTDAYTDGYTKDLGYMELAIVP